MSTSPSPPAAPPDFGERVEGIDIPVFNEHAVRASAGLLFLAGIVAFMAAALTGAFDPLRVFAFLFMVDMMLGLWRQPSVSALAASSIASSLRRSRNCVRATLATMCRLAGPRSVVSYSTRPTTKRGTLSHHSPRRRHCRSPTSRHLQLPVPRCGRFLDRLPKTHHYQWNVVGPVFRSLHEMFTAEYTVTLAVDGTAERIRPPRSQL